MRALALLVIVSLTAGAQRFDPRFQRFGSRTDQGRSRRGFFPSGVASFEAFAGTGTTTACSTTAPTSAQGGATTSTRASGTTCTATTTGGLSTSGIVDGDLRLLSTNVIDVEYDNLGNLGIRQQPIAYTDSCIQDAQFCNAAWADIGTPNCTADQLSGPWGTTTMDLFTDNDGAAFEGRSQAIASTTATKHAVAVYVKAGTSAKVTVSMVGTGSSTGDCTATSTVLSSTTSTRVSCISPAAYAGTLTSITISVTVGTVVADQGTIYVESADHFTDVSLGLPNTIPTTTVAVTQAADTPPSWAQTWSAASKGCGAVSITTNYTPTTGVWWAMPLNSANPDMLGRFSAGNAGCYMIDGTDLAAGTWTTGTNRWICSTVRSSYLNGTSASSATNTMQSGGAGGSAILGIGSTGGFGNAVQGIYSRLVWNPTSTHPRCAP